MKKCIICTNASPFIKVAIKNNIAVASTATAASKYKIIQNPVKHLAVSMTKCELCGEMACGVKTCKNCGSMFCWGIRNGYYMSLCSAGPDGPCLGCNVKLQ